MTIKDQRRSKPRYGFERWSIQHLHVIFLSSVLVFVPIFVILITNMPPQALDSNKTTTTTTTATTTIMTPPPPDILKSRIVAAIRGALVADAASMGTHWIYDPDEMKKTVDSVEAPEFKNPPVPRYYNGEQFPGHYGPGMLSPYGEQMLFVAEHVVAAKGIINGAVMSKAMLEWANTFGGRPDHALQTFVENMKKPDGSGQWPNCGADDDQAHIFMKVVPVTCLYAGKPELREKVIEAIQVHQNNKTAIAFGLAAACILEAVLLGSSLQDALDHCLKHASNDSEAEKSKLIKAYQRGKVESTKYATLNALFNQLSTEEFYYKASRTCKLPQSFTGPIYQLYKAAADYDAGGASAATIYAKAVRENIMASGDTCGRSPLVGAVLAALNPNTAPLESWILKTDSATYSRIDAAAHAIAQLATAKP